VFKTFPSSYFLVLPSDRSQSFWLGQLFLFFLSRLLVTTKAKTKTIPLINNRHISSPFFVALVLVVVVIVSYSTAAAAAASWRFVSTSLVM